MSGYNFKVAWRSLKAHRFYSTLNIVGLAVGMATSLLLLIWVHYQFSFDKFNSDYAQIYRLNTTIQSEDGPITWGEAPSGLPVLAQGITGIEKTVRFKSWGDQNISTFDKTRVFDGNTIAYVDPDILSVFDYPLIQGDNQTFLKNINGAAITQELAIKLFGTEKVIGKKIRYYGDIFKVSAVLKDFPENSSLKYSALFPMSAYSRRMVAAGSIPNNQYVEEAIDNIEFQDFLVLSPTTNPASIAAAISKNYERQKDQSLRFSLQPLKDLHLIAPDGNSSDLHMVQLMLAVALLILLVACINYMNLTTARSLTRLKEVSVRKINGAAKMQLFWQFMTEALLLFLGATAVALGLIYGLLPIVSQFMNADLRIALQDSGIVKIIAGVLLGTLLVATVFPAYLLSRLQAASAIKGIRKEGQYARLRKALVILQFTATFILLMGAIVVHRQMHFLVTKDIGYNKSYAFAAPMTNNMVSQSKALEAELLKSSSILSAGISNAYDISRVQNQTSNVDWAGKTGGENTLFAGLSADKAFMNTLKFRFVAGSNFSAMPSDSNKYILNEAAVKRMGLHPPYTGQRIVYSGIPGEVIGVVKDFNYEPLTNAIGPMIIDSRGFKNILYVRTTAQHAQTAIQETKRLYTKYSAGSPFSYYFLDKNFADKYQVIQRTGELLKAFSIVALLISCLGLLGLATYTAEVKKKEIGIRKVLGASVNSITGLITGQFLKLVLMAVAIGAPIAYLVVENWQSHFAYKAEIGIGSFLIGAVFVILITILTILFTALKSARANPVNSLKGD